MFELEDYEKNEPKKSNINHNQHDNTNQNTNQPNATNMAEQNNSHTAKSKARHSMLDWSPLETDSSNFATHELHKTSYKRIEVRQTMGGLLFYLGFLVGGFGWLIISINQWDSWDSNIKATLFTLVFIPFILVGLKPFRNPETGVFDKSMGWFWFGSNKLTTARELRTLDEKYQLSKIFAVQIIQDYAEDSEGDKFRFYELNLVMENNERHNIMRQGNYDMMSDGKLLANFLGVPCYVNFVTTQHPQNNNAKSNIID